MKSHLSRLIFQLFAALPLRWAQSLGRLLGRIAYRTSPGYRSKFDVQWTAARTQLPDLYNTASKATAIAQAGAMFTEIPLVWSSNDTELLKRVRISHKAAELLKEASSEACLFLTPHWGAFEVAGRVIAAHLPITVLFKPAKQAWLNDLMVKARAHGQMQTAPADLSGVRTLLRTLRDGQSVGILPDQVPTAGDGHWVSFFGRPALTMTLPERLAKSAKAVILVKCSRLDNGQGWYFDAHRLPTPMTTQQMNQAVEALVHEDPTQYLWGYNRFKGDPNQ